jgi:hypothetical protein
LENLVVIKNPEQYSAATAGPSDWRQDMSIHDPPCFDLHLVPWCVRHQLQYMWQRLLLRNRRLQLEAATAAAWLGQIAEMKGHLLAELPVTQMPWRRELGHA